MRCRGAVALAILLAAVPLTGARRQSSDVQFQISSSLPWVEQSTYPGVRLRGVSAVDSRVVWASGTKGTFFRTTDGGMHWPVGTVPDAADLDTRSSRNPGPNEVEQLRFLGY